MSSAASSRNQPSNSNTKHWSTVPMCSLLSSDQWLKWFCEAGGGAHLTKPGWSKPHTHSNPTNLALFRRKITLYRFNHGGAHTIAGWGAQMGAGGLNPPPPSPPHFNHCFWRSLDFIWTSQSYPRCTLTPPWSQEPVGTVSVVSTPLKV